MTDMLTAALSCAAFGWPVLPCSVDDKRPLTARGFKDATTDPDTIQDWWREYPHAMIGVPTGAPMGAFVIDIDPKDGDTAEAVLARVVAEIGQSLPPAPMVRTPRGGLHVYFAMPEGQTIGNRGGVIPGVDVRGDGGYVIVPPSARYGAKAKQDGCDGVAYAWEPDADLGTLNPPAPPQVLLDFVARRYEEDGEETPTAPAAPTGQSDAVRKFVLSALDAETRAVAEAGKGTRNDTLNRAALALGQLVGAGVLSEAAATSALEDAAAQSGLAKEDGRRSVRATIRSGMTAGKAQPRDLSGVGQRIGRSAARRPEAPMPDDPAAPSDDQSRASRGEDGLASGGGAGGDGGGSIDWEVVSRCAGEPQNDTGNARRLMAHFGHDLLYVRDIGMHWWAGTHWETTGGDEVAQRMAQKTAERIKLEPWHMAPSDPDAEAIEAAEPLFGKPTKEMTDQEKATLKAGAAAGERLEKAKAARHKFAISSGNANRVNAMVSMALPHITVAPEDLDAESLAINVRNGTLRLYPETVEEPDPDCPDPETDRRIQVTRWRVRLDAHERQDRIAKVMPVEYDPAAAAPKWQAFMERFQPKDPIRQFLQDYHGYALTGLTGEQIFVFNYGLGANGKSTFMEAVARLMGSYAQVLPAEALTGDTQRRGDQATPELARLPGARLVRCAELPRGYGFRESTLKMLTGGEAILVRHLHARFFEFRPEFKAIGSGNDKPNIGGVDEGIWRRMKLVPWEETIPMAEREPMEKILEGFADEASGVLNWLLEGAVRYLEDGLTIPPEIQAATDSYRHDMDPVGEFISACVESAPGEDVTARDMYLAYVAWCHANSVKPYAERGFASIMTQKDFKKETGRIRKYKDLRLKDVPDDPEVKEKYSPGLYGAD